MAVLPLPGSVQWGLEFPVDSPFVFQETWTNLVPTCCARSVMYHIAALTYYSQIEWCESESYLDSARPARPRQRSDCVRTLFHTSRLSLSQAHLQSCPSISEKIMIIKGPSCTDTVIVLRREGGQLLCSLVFSWCCFVSSRAR